jgi:hypothetical protein
LSRYNSSWFCHKKREEREPVREGERLGPSVAHAGRGEERGPEGGREREFGLLAAGPFSFLLLFFFFPTLNYSNNSI